MKKYIINRMKEIIKQERNKHNLVCKNCGRILPNKQMRIFNKCKWCDYEL